MGGRFNSEWVDEMRRNTHFGYVGYGEVLKQAVMINKFIPENESNLLIDLPLSCLLE
jgi:hypothetical protein